MDDMEIGNVHCISCRGNMMYSELHSNNEHAFFYCNNPRCELNLFLIRDNELIDITPVEIYKIV